MVWREMAATWLAMGPTRKVIPRARGRARLARQEIDIARVDFSLSRAESRRGAGLHQ
jgi:hypothetical protein